MAPGPHNSLNPTPTVLVVALEASADALAATVVDELIKRVPAMRVFGVSGPALRKRGVDTVARAEDFSAMGLADVIRKVPRLSTLMLELVSLARARRPVFALLVDSPDFTLRLGARLKLHGIPVAMLVAPQTWAWRARRARTLGRSVDVLLTLFPFEAPLFAQYGVPTHFIGHPLAHRARLRSSGTPGRPAVALLPGSRPAEVERHLDVMLAAQRSLQALTGASRTIVSVAPTIPWPMVADRVKDRMDIQMVEGVAPALDSAVVAVAVSGTASLEAALAGVPTVVVYKTHTSTYLAARLLVRTPYIALPNLLQGGELFPELLQDRVTAPAITAAASRVLDRSSTLVAACETLSKTLAPDPDTSPGSRAAELLLAHEPKRLRSPNPQKKPRMAELLLRYAVGKPAG